MSDTSGDTGGDGDEDEMLETASGCPGVFNINQVLDYHLELDPADWATIKADETFTLEFPAQFWCGELEPITIGVRRKRSGGTDKVGLKLDFNEFVMGQRYMDLKKFNLENGVGSGSPDNGSADAIVREYLSWRIMQRAGLVASRVAIARLFVNGELVGAFSNVEQVDKRFLKKKTGESDGFLWKFSGAAGDGQKTREGEVDPYDAYFCFFKKGGGSCPVPDAATLAEELPSRLDIPVLSRMGAAEALMANQDAPLFKDNNYYFYDSDVAPRLYLPWDLDTTMNNGALHVIDGGVGGQVEFYKDALYSNWEAEYRADIADLLEVAVSEAAIDEELATLESVSAEAFSGDPHAAGDVGAIADSLREWWSQRRETVTAQLQ